MSDLEEELAWQLKTTKLPLAVREYVFAAPRKFRADFAWPERLLLVEVDGGSFVQGRHNRAGGFATDCEKLNLGTLAGYRWLRFTGSMIHDGMALKTIEEALRAFPDVL